MGIVKVLVTGATGFVGGSVLAQLLASTDANIKAAELTAIVRRQEQVDTLKKHGVHAQLFNGLDDCEQLRQIASEFDVVLHCATGMHVGSAEALVLGLGDALKKTGRQTHFIHTTGTSNLADSTLTTQSPPLRDFSDADDDVYAEEVRRDAQVPSYTQRRTDVVVHETAEKTGVRPYLMMPPTIYGRGMGFFNTQSMQIPSKIDRALSTGRVEYIGDGSGTVGYVHVADLAQLYELLLAKVLAGDDDVPHGRKGYYFSNTGEYTWREVSEKLGAIGNRMGLLKSPEPASVTLDEALQNWNLPEGARLAIEMNYAAKTRTTPKHADRLGWKPTRTAADWDAELEEAWKIKANK